MPSLRQIRLASGLILFTYATLHFANHALGNISVAAMDSGARLPEAGLAVAAGRADPLRCPVHPHGSGLLGALRAPTIPLDADRGDPARARPRHSVPARRPFRRDARVAQPSTEPRRPIRRSSTASGSAGRRAGSGRSCCCSMVWTHGCIGMNFWLSLKPSYPRSQHACFAFAVLLPALALLGRLAGRQGDPGDRERPRLAGARTHARACRDACAERRLLDRERAMDPRLLVAALAGAVAARRRSPLARARVGTIRLTYPDRAIRAPRGLTILEASLRNNIPHAHVCGGRGRCSTCRIRVMASERRSADRERRRAGGARAHRAGPDVRLACQLRPTATSPSCRCCRQRDRSRPFGAAASPMGDER